MVEQFPGQTQSGRGHAGPQINTGDFRFTDIFAAAQSADDTLDLPDVSQLRRSLADGVIQPCLDGMIRRQSVHPGGQEQVQLLHGELIEDGLEDIGHILLPQVQAVHRGAVHLIPGGNIPGNGLRPVSPGVSGVQQYDKGFSQLLEFPDYPLFRLQIVLPGNVGHRAVGGNDDTDGRVL